MARHQLQHFPIHSRALCSTEINNPWRSRCSCSLVNMFAIANSTVSESTPRRLSSPSPAWPCAVWPALRSRHAQPSGQLLTRTPLWWGLNFIPPPGYSLIFETTLDVDPKLQLPCYLWPYTWYLYFLPFIRIFLLGVFNPNLARLSATISQWYNEGK